METNPATWVIFGGCLALSFILSGMEAGVFALSRLRIRQRMHAGKSSARLLLHFLENPENFLWTIFVGNTVANFYILGLVILVLHQYLGEWQLWFALAFVAVVFFFYAFFDLLPKMLFRTYPNRLCMALARPFRLIHLILRPLVALVEWVSGTVLQWTGRKAFGGYLFGNREELRFLMQESAQAFTSEERMMINRVLDLQSLTVRQITTPLAQVVMVEAKTPIRDVLALAREDKLNRLPVWELREGRKRIIGLLNLDALLFRGDVDPAKPVSVYTKAGLFLEENLRVEIAMRRMQRGGQRLAVVLDREKREMGVVSLQDVLKAVFGELNL
ncbi:MAG TPA: CNNM domain-containing protein [Verrucomicrobiae bacterium]|nr:CNNM domain-containing protein [Verrucomicrobiae bacterium]